MNRKLMQNLMRAGGEGLSSTWASVIDAANAARDNTVAAYMEED